MYTQISGPLELETFCKAAAHVVSSTESLRLRFQASNEDLWQEVHEVFDYVLPVFDVSSASDPHAAGLALINENLRHAFKLEAEAPFRWIMIKTGESEWLWGQTYHHIALDGQSAWIVSNRVAETYSSLEQGRLAPEYPGGGIAVLTAEDLSYRASLRFLDDQRYWISRLKGSERMKSWSSRSRFPSSIESILHETFLLPNELSNQVRDLATQMRLRAEHIIIAAAAILQSVYQGQQDITLGTHLLGRVASSAKSFPAMMSNECHIRLIISPEVELEVLSKEISRQLRLALRHQTYRNEDLRNDLGLAKGAPDFFSLSVNIMPMVQDLNFHRTQTSSHYLSYGPVRDLSLTLFDNKMQTQLRLDLDGNGALYSQNELKENLSRLVFIIKQVVTSTGPIGSLALCEDTQDAEIDSIKLKKAAISQATVPDLIASIIDSCRDKQAILGDDTTITYEDLDQRSNRLARYLIQQGVRADLVVAIGLSRSVEMVVAVLSVLKAGGVCLPLDPNYPSHRLHFMLKDSGAALILTQSSCADIFEDCGVPTIQLTDSEIKNKITALNAYPVQQHERNAALYPLHIAFLFYTSGTTGQPKGVGVTHENLVHKLQDQIQLWNVDASSRFAFSSSINFDPSLHQMLLPLVAGGTCVVLSLKAGADPDLFIKTITETAVTHLDVVPSFAAVLADHHWVLLSELKFFILGGEVLPISLANKLRSCLPKCRLFNMYGPTETCVDATSYEILNGDGKTPIPIGKALPDYRIHILDDCLRQLPQGAIGDLYISGTGVTRGYWQQPGLTAERFLPCPFGAPGERMYRTGDRAYQDALGDIIFCGRSDAQVKLRGFRIELTEIEAALLGLSGVAQAAAIIDNSGSNSRLIAYVSALRGVKLNTPDLRNALACLLPDFMIPSAIITLEDMPVLSNGKLDRHALPKVRQDDSYAYVAPSNDLEAYFCQLFGRLTETERVSALDNFFILGGHSLLVMRLISLMRSERGHHLPIETVFAHPTPRALAKITSTQELSTQLSSYQPIVNLRASGSYKPLFCVHPAAGLPHVYLRIIDSIDERIPLYGLQARGIDDEMLPHKTIQEMAQSYVKAIRLLQPGGPYSLLGWSFGGVVAHEMAYLLEAEGQKVCQLILIDSYFSPVNVDVLDPLNLDPIHRDLLSANNSLFDSHPLESIANQSSNIEHWAQRMTRAFIRSSQLLSQHKPRKINAPVGFLRAEDNIDSDLDVSLKKITSGLITIEQAKAGHYLLFDPAHVLATGEQINRLLSGVIDNPIVMGVRKCLSGCIRNR